MALYQIVVYDRPMPGTQGLFDHNASDVSGSACYKDVHLK